MRRPVVQVLPALPSLDEEQATRTLPLLLALPAASLKTAIVQLLHAEPPPLPPATLMLQLHLIDAAAHGVPLKSQIDAVQVAAAASCARHPHAPPTTHRPSPVTLIHRPSP